MHSLHTCLTTQALCSMQCSCPSGVSVKHTYKLNICRLFNSVLSTGDVMPVIEKDVEWQSPGKTHNITQLACTVMTFHMRWTTVHKCATGYTLCILISCLHSLGAEITVVLFHHLLFSMSFYNKKTICFRAGEQENFQNNGTGYS